MPAVRGDADANRRDELVRWRCQYLTWAGLDPALAAVMAGDLRWDLHALLELLERGCPSALAARILAPDDDEEVSGG
jgi:hypothetical protein